MLGLFKLFFEAKIAPAVEIPSDAPAASGDLQKLIPSQANHSLRLIATIITHNHLLKYRRGNDDVPKRLTKATLSCHSLYQSVSFADVPFISALQNCDPGRSCR